MDNLRIVGEKSIATVACCSRCSQQDARWDRIAGKAYCPACEEMLAMGEGEPLVERTEKHRCAICNQVGTVQFVSFPLDKDVAIEMDLCPGHLRNLLGRRLAQHAFQQIRRRLVAAGVRVEEVFLLHDAFYDREGRALHPALDLG